MNSQEQFTIHHWPTSRSLTKAQREELARMRRVSLAQKGLESGEVREQLRELFIGEVEPFFSTEHLQPNDDVVSPFINYAVGEYYNEEKLDITFHNSIVQEDDMEDWL